MVIERIRLLYAYNRWANARALAAAAALAADQLHRDLGASHGSVFETLVHILWEEWLWLARWLAPLTVPGSDPLTCRTQSVLQTRWGEIERLQTESVPRFFVSSARPPPQPTSWCTSMSSRRARASKA